MVRYFFDCIATDWPTPGSPVTAFGFYWKRRWLMARQKFTREFNRFKGEADQGSEFPYAQVRKTEFALKQRRSW